MKDCVFSGCFSSLLVYLVLMGFGFVSLPMIKQIVCFSGPQSPLRETQKLNLQVSPHRAGILSLVLTRNLMPCTCHSVHTRFVAGKISSL